jgi:hypothetical protein
MTISDFLQVDIVINVAQGNLFHNVLRLGAVPHITNFIINHYTLSGIALNRC